MRSAGTLTRRSARRPSSKPIPRCPYRSVSKGDTVSFGSYEQDGNAQNGPEPIQWIVLDKIDGQLLLLSADVLEARQYHHVPFEEVTWENSDLRAWMNGDFYDGAFTPVQRGLIATVHNENADQSITGASGGAATDDRVFALSETESVIYLNTPAARSDIGAAPASASRGRRAPEHLRGRHGRLVAALSPEPTVSRRNSSTRRACPRSAERTSTCSTGCVPRCGSTSQGSVRGADE